MKLVTHLTPRDDCMIPSDPALVEVRRQRQTQMQMHACMRHAQDHNCKGRPSSQPSTSTVSQKLIQLLSIIIRLGDTLFR